MLSLRTKILYLQELLLLEKGNYADCFKADILIYFDEFDVENKALEFLDKFKDKEQIELWLNNLLSQIILKFDDEQEQLSDFIFEFTEKKYVANFILQHYK